jgi:uncharacterized protein
MNRRPRLAVLARVPVPGLAKTRLIPEIGPEGAARVCGELVEHTLRRLRPLEVCGEVRLEVRVDGSLDEARAWLGRGTRYRSQGDGDLGQRIARVFAHAFATGVEKVVVVGSDCPGISHRHVRETLAVLDSADLVLGPAEDGGYYLIGLRRTAAGALPRLLDVEWSTERVLRDTLAAASDEGLATSLLETLRDVDRPEDLPAWREAAAEEARPPRTISVVIPALNELARVAAAVASAREADVQVIVVDGGSIDGTRTAAAEAGAIVVGSPPGRARQMNAGAEAASGDALVFLHADTLLPAGFSADIRRALANPAIPAGAFTFGTDLRSAAMRFVERTVDWRARGFGMPYGDQAQFVRAEVFRAVGGFPDLPVMEDYELMLRLRRLGHVIILPKVATTSGRSWAEHGVVRTTVANKAAIWGYRLGVRADLLADWREAIRRR